MAKVGRPRALDDVKKRKFCALIALGYGLERAALAVGCAVRTVRRTANRDSKFDGDWRNAELIAVVTPLNTLQAAARENWRAACWFMERVYPQQFSKRSPQHLTTDAADAYIGEIFEEVMRACADSQSRKKMGHRLLELIDLWKRDFGMTRVIRRTSKKSPSLPPSDSFLHDVNTVGTASSVDTQSPGDVKRSGVNATETGVNETQTAPKCNVNEP